MRHRAAPRDSVHFDRLRRTGLEELPLILTAASAVAGVAGTAISIAGAQSQASANASAASTNAAIMAQNAKIALDEGNLNAANQQRQTIIALGAARAGYGASGVTAEGSPQDVLGSSAANAELDRQVILYKSRLKAFGFNTQADLDTGRAQTALVQGNETASRPGWSGSASPRRKAMGCSRNLAHPRRR
jgi:hypothetical protein